MFGRTLAGGSSVWLGILFLVLVAHTPPARGQRGQRGHDPYGALQRLPAFPSGIVRMRIPEIASGLSLATGVGVDTLFREQAAGGLRLDGDVLGVVATLGVGFWGRLELSAMLPAVAYVRGGSLSPPLEVTGGEVERMAFELKAVLWKPEEGQNGLSLGVVLGAELPVIYDGVMPPGILHRYSIDLLATYRFAWGMLAAVDLRMVINPGWDFNEPRIDTVSAAVGLRVPLWGDLAAKVEGRVNHHLYTLYEEGSTTSVNFSGGLDYRPWHGASIDFAVGGNPMLPERNIQVMGIFRFLLGTVRPPRPSAPSPWREKDEDCERDAVRKGRRLAGPIPPGAAIGGKDCQAREKKEAAPAPVAAPDAQPQDERLARFLRRVKRFAHELALNPRFEAGAGLPVPVVGSYFSILHHWAKSTEAWFEGDLRGYFVNGGLVTLGTIALTLELGSFLCGPATGLCAEGEEVARVAITRAVQAVEAEAAAAKAAGQVARQAEEAASATMREIKEAERVLKRNEGGAGLARSKHASLRSTQGRPVPQASQDLTRARPADVFMQQDGRILIRGARGREHIIDLDGTHITSLKRSNSAHQARLQNGAIRPASAAEVEAAKGLLR